MPRRRFFRHMAEVLEQDYVDLVIVVDDASKDETVDLARRLPKTKVFVHESNLGYGGSQKTCYRQALLEGGDIIIMVHPDYQYTPKLIPAFVSMIGNGLYHFVLGFEDFRRLRPQRGNALVQIHLQPGIDLR